MSVGFIVLFYRISPTANPPDAEVVGSPGEIAIYSNTIYRGQERLRGGWAGTYIALLYK